MHMQIQEEKQDEGMKTDYFFKFWFFQAEQLHP
jgi:hypothetical protein